MGTHWRVSAGPLIPRDPPAKSKPCRDDDQMRRNIAQEYCLPSSTGQSDRPLEPDPAMIAAFVEDVRQLANEVRLEQDILANVTILDPKSQFSEADLRFDLIAWKTMNVTKEKMLACDSVPELDALLKLLLNVIECVIDVDALVFRLGSYVRWEVGSACPLQKFPNHPVA